MNKVDQFDPSAVATSTFYPKWYKGRRVSIKHADKVHGDLAIEFIRTAREKGF